jgi:uncharacterized repeat protein (TIGR02543 family)
MEDGMHRKPIVIIKYRYLLGLAIILCILGYIPTDTFASEVAGNMITVTFDANGGTSDVVDMQAMFGDSYGPLPSATRDNYEFIGWYTYISGGIKITETTKVFKPLNHTLFARWRGEETEITLETDEGILNSNTVKVYYGSKYYNQLPTPIKENYKFAGWYTADTGGDKITAKSIFTESSPTTLYARWTEKTVKVIFVAFNGEAYDKEVTNGIAYGDLPEPEKENYTFDGWYKLKDYTNNNAEPITADTIVNEVGRIKLFARWYPDKQSSNQ